MDNELPPPYDAGHATSGNSGSPSGGGLRSIKPDMNYVKTIPGILKALEFMLFMFAFGLVGNFNSHFAATSSRLSFFLLVAVLSWLGTIALFVMYLLRIVDMLRSRFKFVTVALVALHLVGAIFMLVADALVLDQCRLLRSSKWCDVNEYTATSCGVYEAGGAFGFFCVLAVAGDTALHFVYYMRERRAEAERASAPSADSA